MQKEGLGLNETDMGQPFLYVQAKKNIFMKSFSETFRIGKVFEGNVLCIGIKMLPFSGSSWQSKGVDSLISPTSIIWC